MAFKSTRKWIVLIVVILSFVSLLVHLFIARFSPVELVQYDSMAGSEDHFVSISRRHTIRNEKPPKLIKPPQSMQPYTIRNEKPPKLIKPLQSMQPYAYSRSSYREHVNKYEVFHDRHIFQEDYEEMKRSFKIYVYPHRRDDPFANVLLPVDSKPGGNYASEGYFKMALSKSRFVTEDPNKADLFFLPFSIARLRHDPRVSVGGIPEFVRDYISNVRRKYPYWNRTGGADHFYVACHSIGRSAMEKATEVKLNAIQIVCSSSYFVGSYISHKDACLPQIWPREGDPPNLLSSNRTKLAFFAGAMNSPVRKQLVQVWRNDSEIFVHHGRLKTPYADELLGSKFCLHAKGFEVNTARIADSLYYGCVPVILANYYDLPFIDILNWKSFSVVVATQDIPLLKKILRGISSDEYLRLQRNVLKVRKHFLWHPSPRDYDAFYMVMYELWLRRSLLRVPFSVLKNW
ncbi:probable glycosyltransferase At5g03795 isoform X3 [Morus notabilis]|uniref:probable glycosyltransferase At5g03795 isoform X3 n=1 Tax=Morus notabilis TaxID=981085 RepID=UPI000CED4F60|nr:probable glycosyltransferase At5g03795 isoform X3 [Morus notabilis]